MESFYPIISVISMVAFAWVGHTLARHRNRNATGWGVAGAFLPPVLLILWRLKPLAVEDDADDDGAEEATA